MAVTLIKKRKDENILCTDMISKREKITIEENIRGIDWLERERESFFGNLVLSLSPEALVNELGKY